MYSGAFTNNVTMVGWYICDGNNGTPNLVDKFVRGGATSGATGGSDDAVVVSHAHNVLGIEVNAGSGVWGLRSDGASIPSLVVSAGVSGVGKNIPAYHVLIYIMRIS